MVLVYVKIVLLLFLFLNVCEAISGKPEGSDCTVNGHKGKCINYQKCMALAIMLNNDYKNTEVELCSFDGDIPIICCTECDFSTNITNMVFTHTGDVRWKTEQISQEKCHTYSDAALASDRCIFNQISWATSWIEEKQCDSVEWYIETAIGGQRARRNEFPHMALLGYGERLISAKWLCSGSLISERFILTAGHCTAHAQFGPVKYAALGILRRSDPPRWWHRYNVKNIILHPDYHSPHIYNDIALLELMTTVTFRPSVFPACLPFPNVEAEFGRQSVTATGWGATGNYGLDLAETLQVIKVKEFPRDECEEQYKDKRLMKPGYNHTIQMCYGDHDKVVDTCQGDSGGPLQIHTNLCMYVVLGVTSSGTQCGTLGGAGLYTRVQHYLPWIESLVWTDELPDKTDIWRDLILKKLEEKRRSSISTSSIRPDKDEISIGFNTETPDVTEISTKSYSNLNSSTEKSENISKDAYNNILDQNDWIAFLNKHLNESVSKKTTEWIGTEIPDLLSVSDELSTSSVKPDDDYDTIEPTTDSKTDSHKPDTTDSDHDDDNDSSYSYYDESDYNDETDNLEKALASDFEIYLKAISKDREHSTNNAEISTNAVEISSEYAEITTGPVKISTDAVEISTDTVKIPSRYSEISTDPVEISTDAIEIPSTNAEITTDPVEISTIEEPVHRYYNSSAHSIRPYLSKNIELLILPICSLILRL